MLKGLEERVRKADRIHVEGALSLHDLRTPLNEASDLTSQLRLLADTALQELSADAITVLTENDTRGCTHGARGTRSPTMSSAYDGLAWLKHCDCQWSTCFRLCGPIDGNGAHLGSHAGAPHIPEGTPRLVSCLPFWRTSVPGWRRQTARAFRRPWRGTHSEYPTLRHFGKCISDDGHCAGQYTGRKGPLLPRTIRRESPTFLVKSRWK